MLSSAWVPAALTVLLAGASGYHLLRLGTGVGTRHARPDLDLTHILMGVTMAWMLLAGLARPYAVGLVAGFGLAGAWYTVAAVRRYVRDGPGQVGRDAIQAVGCAAMAWMLVPAAGLGRPLGADAMGPAVSGLAMPGMAMPAGGAEGRVLTVAVLVAVAVASGWTLRRAVTRPDRPRGAHADGPLAAGCQLAMNAAAAYMLLGLL